MKTLLLIALVPLVTVVLMLTAIQSAGAAVTKSAHGTVVCGQTAYIGHNARYWYTKFRYIMRGKIRANVNLQKYPKRFRRMGCPRSIWNGHGPEYWHYKAAVLTAKARAKKLALEYQSKPARAVRVALKYIGTWYVWGGSHYPPGFDCSGLVQFAYSQVGVYLPRTTYSQRYMGRRVFFGELKVGDILFFNYYAHEAMYIGHGMMVEAPHSGSQVRISPVRSYIEARRVV